jgi:two-component sensor histidine kinase
MAMTLWFRQRSIRFLIYMLPLAFALPVAAMLAWFLAANLQVARDASELKLRELAENTAAALDLVLRGHEDILSRFAARTLVRALDVTKSDPLIAEYMQIHPEFNNIVVRDRQGDYTYSYLPNFYSAQRARTFPWFQEVLSNGKFTVGNAFPDNLSGRWVSVLSYPVRNDEGKVAGALNIALDLPKLNERLFYHVPKTAVIKVLDRNLVTLLRSKDHASFIGKQESSAVWDATRGQREGFLSARGLDGVQRLNAYVTMPGVGWRVVAGLPEDEVLADYHRLLRRTIVLGLGVLLLTLLLAWRIAAAIVKPIAALNAAAASVAAGDAAARAPLAAPLEIAAVARQFNHMLDARDRSEAALQSSLHEKEALLNEVHHRVKNNLQVIISLLRLEVGRSVQPEVKTVLGEMQGRIRSMALLHELLYRSGLFAALDLGGYLKQVATQALRMQAIHTGAVQLQLDLAPVKAGVDQATPCGLLVNELISNCVKHGFPQGRNGVVLVQLQAVEGAGVAGLLRLCVTDTGIGLPLDFEARRNHSLGLQLVSDLIGQLGGTLMIGPVGGPGAVFAVTFVLDRRQPTAQAY